MKNKEISILGQGITGLSIAYRLAKLGYDVTVHGDDERSSASWVATGLASIKGLNRSPRSKLFKMKLSSHKKLFPWIQNFEADLKSAGMGSVLPIFYSGMYEPILNLRDYRDIHHRVHMGFSAEKLGNQWVDRDSLNELFGFHDKSGFDSAHILGSFFYPQDIYMNPASFLVNLKNLLIHFGVKFDDRNIGKVEYSSRVFCLKSNHVDKLCKGCVIIAAGAGSKTLLHSSGFSDDFLSTNEGVKIRFTRTHESTPLALKKERLTWLRTKELDDSSIGSKNKNTHLVHDLVVQTPNEFTVEETLALYSEHMGLDLKRYFDGFEPEIHTATRVKAPSRVPLIKDIGVEKDIPARRLILATGMHKSGYQLFPEVAEKVESILSSANQ